MAKTVTLTIVVPDDFDDQTISDFVQNMEEDFSNDSAQTGFPAWVVLNTDIRPANAKEVAAANLEDNSNEDEVDEEG